MKRFLLALIALGFLAAVPAPAEAANRYAVCSTTCTWDNSSTAMWCATDTGCTGATAPTSADDVFLNTNTCVGGTTCTITVNANLSIKSLTMGTCTASTSGCILDFAANNNNITVAGGVSGTGNGTRTLNMGNGVWTFGGGNWNFITTTGLTLNINSSSIVWTASNIATSFFGGAKTWGALTINANSGANQSAYYQFESGNSASNTFASLTINGPANITLRQGVTQTFTGGITVSGSSASNLVHIGTDGASGSGSATTIAVGATSNVQWVVWRGVVGATSTINSTNSYSLGSNSGTLSITNPAGGGGGGKIIGG